MALAHEVLRQLTDAFVELRVCASKLGDELGDARKQDVKKRALVLDSLWAQVGHRVLVRDAPSVADASVAFGEMPSVTSRELYSANLGRNPTALTDHDKIFTYGQVWVSRAATGVESARP